MPQTALHRIKSLSSVVVALFLSVGFGVVAVSTSTGTPVHAACVPSLFVGYNSINAFDTSTFAAIDLNGASTGNALAISNATTYDMTVTPDGSTMIVSTSSGLHLVDTSTNTTTNIPIGGTAWSTVVAPDGTTAYTTDHTNGQLEIIDLGTNTISSSVNLGGTNPSALAVKPDGSQVWIRFNQTNGIAIYDTASNSLLDADSNTAGVQFFFAGSTTSTVSQGQGLSLIHI